LSFNISSNERIVNSVLELNETTNYTLQDNQSYIFNFTDLVGNLSFKVYHTDLAGNSLTTDSFTAQVNSTPNITSFSPLLNTSISENSTLNFSISVSDLDSYLFTYSWYIDNNIIDTTQNTSWTPNFTDAGIHTVNVSVSDGAYITTKSWNVIVNNTNQAPNITLFTPTNTTPIIQNTESIEFTITTSDADNDNLTYSWIANSTQNSTSQNYTYSPSTADTGAINLTVIVNDGNTTTRQEWNISLLTDEDNDGVDNSQDFVQGNSSNIISNANIGITINSSTMLNQAFTGNTTINITNNSSPLIEFSYILNATNKLDFRNISITVNKSLNKERAWRGNIKS